LGRWINRDPIGEEGGINLTLYCENNAIGHFDILGLASYLPPVLPPPGAIPIPGPTPKPNPNPPPNITDCPKKAPAISGGSAWCLDDVFSPITHPGLTCYREVAPCKTEGNQCCYDSDGNLAEESPDIVNPACGVKANGSCRFSIGRICNHCIADVAPALFEKMKEYVETCGCEKWEDKYGEGGNKCQIQ